MSKRVDNVYEKKEEKKLQDKLSSRNSVSDDVINTKPEVTMEETLDIDAELLKTNPENSMLDDDFDDFIHSQETKNLNLKAIPDENDYEETIVIPEISESAIKKAKEDAKKNKKDKKDSENKTEEPEKIVEKKSINAPKAEAVSKKASKKKEASNNTKKNQSTKKSKSKSDKNSRKEQTKKKKSKKLPIILGTIFGLILISVVGVYVGFAKYFESHYLFNTSINGKDFSLKTAEDAKTYMADQMNGYELLIEESDGSTEKIYGSDIGIKFESEEELDQIIEKQSNWTFIESLNSPTEITTNMAVSIDENLFKDQISQLKCMDKENQKASKSAYPEFDENEGQYVIHPEQIGTSLKEDVFESAVMEAVLSLNETINLEESGCYKKPKYTSNSKKINKCVKNLNKYLKAEITYDFSPLEVTVGPTEIQEWLSYDKKTFEVKFDEEQVRQYVENLAVNYNTVGNSRTFIGGDGISYEVSGGAYGFAIDKETEYEDLLANIKNGDVVYREPAYYQRGVCHGDADFGDTFAEVNLTTQHMYYVQNGETVMDSDVVTGIPVNGHATPEGVYSVAWMQSPSVLKGQNDDGSKYKTKVQYWMAFNYDIGFHDASWQPTFGGDRYTYGGSHGCVNMPTEAAGKLYGLISNGIPVVVHF